MFDRNQVIGIVLISSLFLIYIYFWGDQPNKENTTAISKDTIQTVVAGKDTLNRSTAVLQAAPDSAQLDALYGVFSAGAVGTEQLITLENKNIKVVFSTKGAKVVSAELKEYKTWNGNVLELFNAKNHTSTLEVKIKPSNKSVNLNELYYLPAVTRNAIKFTVDAGNGRTLVQSYTLPDEGFKLNHQIQMSNMEAYLSSPSASLTWNTKLPKVEFDKPQERDRSTINYYQTDGNFDYLTEASTSEETDSIGGVKWFSFKNKFFNHALINEKGFSSVSIRTTPSEDTSVIKNCYAKANLATADLAGGLKMDYYFGPNKYDVCNGVTEGFEENVNLGWPIVKLINRFLVLPIFNMLSSTIASYGIIIIILVFLLKLALFPLSYKSYISMAKMRIIKPELDEIKAKHEGDMQKIQSEQMSLYQKVGINPLSGCIPVLLQMPILFALFSFFPTAIELRGESFLWAKDLSTYDNPIILPFTIPFYGSHVSIFTLLMTISTLVYTWFNNQMSTVEGPMKFVSYTMPVVFMFVLNSFPAGLSFYYFMSNVVTIGQQVIIKRFVDEDGIKKQLEENKKNFATGGGAKKSKFMSRIEDAMKAQQENQKNKKKK